MRGINKKEIEKSLDALIEQNTPNEDIMSYLDTLELDDEIYKTRDILHYYM